MVNSLQARLSGQAPGQQFAGMEGHQLHGLAGGVIEMQPGRHQLRLAHQGEALLVERQAVEARAELRGEGFKAIQRPLLLEGEGIALDRVRGIEDAGAAAGCFLAWRGWGAESVPRKKRGLPLMAAARRARRWCSRLATGRQYMSGRRPPWNNALRLMCKWWGVIVAARLALEAATKSAASAVVMCSNTTLRPGWRWRSG